jgi:hypothetical protein
VEKEAQKADTFEKTLKDIGEIFVEDNLNQSADSQGLQTQQSILEEVRKLNEKYLKQIVEQQADAKDLRYKILQMEMAAK